MDKRITLYVETGVGSRLCNDLTKEKLTSAMTRCDFWGMMQRWSKANYASAGHIADLIEQSLFNELTKQSPQFISYELTEADVLILEEFQRLRGAAAPKILAIKYIRARFGIGLMQAKRAVEKWEEDTTQEINHGK